MAQKQQFPFDPEAMMDFFRNNDFTKALQDAKLPNVDAEALFKLGFWESFLCVLSYLKARVMPVRSPRVS